MRVYSPSQTKTYLTCPWLWMLQKQKWVMKFYGKVDLYAIRGTAVSAALEAVNNGVEPFGPLEKSLVEEWEKRQIDTREFAEFKSVPLSRDEVFDQAVALVQAYIKNRPPYFEALHAEYILKDHGWARPDLIGKLANGKIIPIDYKTKDAPVMPWFERKVKADFQNDHQLMHYVWAVGEVFKVECLEYAIVLLWYTKKVRIEYVHFTVSPERLALWLQSARQIWSNMEAAEKDPSLLYEAAEHSTKFGPCPMTDVCLTYNRKPPKSFFMEA